MAGARNCPKPPPTVPAQALDEAGGDLPRALELYEARRAPEAAALVELMTFGGPFQVRTDALKRNDETQK